MNSNAVKLEKGVMNDSIMLKKEIKIEEEEISFEDQNDSASIFETSFQKMNSNSIKLKERIMDDSIMLKKEIKIEEEEITFEDQDDDASIFQTSFQDLYSEDGHKEYSDTFIGKISSESQGDELIEEERKIEKRHILKHQDNAESQAETESRSLTTNFTCYCDVKSYHDFDALIDHLQTHCGEGYTCGLCNQRHSERSWLMEHIMNIHLKVTNYRCDVCSRFFNEINLLKVHEKAYCGTLKCPECGRFLNRKYYLKVHLRKMHNIITP